MSERHLKNIGEGGLFLGGDGQGLDDLRDDPVARENARALKGKRVDAAHLSRYDGTDFVQWQARGSDGYFRPYGKIMLIVKGPRSSPQPLDQR